MSAREENLAAAGFPLVFALPDLLLLESALHLFQKEIPCNTRSSEEGKMYVRP